MKKKSFYPSEWRKRRRILAMGRNQLRGSKWKYPGESWKEAWVREIQEILGDGYKPFGKPLTVRVIVGFPRCQRTTS